MHYILSMPPEASNLLETRRAAKVNIRVCNEQLNETFFVDAVRLPLQLQK